MTAQLTERRERKLLPELTLSKPLRLDVARQQQGRVEGLCRTLVVRSGSNRGIYLNYVMHPCCL
jgi:hypothetical protein